MSTISGGVNGSLPAMTKKKMPSSSASLTMSRSFPLDSASGESPRMAWA